MVAALWRFRFPSTDIRRTRGLAARRSVDFGVSMRSLLARATWPSDLPWPLDLGSSSSPTFRSAFRSSRYRAGPPGSFHRGTRGSGQVPWSCECVHLRHLCRIAPGCAGARSPSITRRLRDTFFTGGRHRDLSVKLFHGRFRNARGQRCVDIAYALTGLLTISFADQGKDVVAAGNG